MDVSLYIKDQLPIIPQSILRSVVDDGQNTDEEMKYSQTINLVAEEEVDITTTLNEYQVPYNYLIEDADGNPIGGEKDIMSKTLVRGVWVLSIYSALDYSAAKLKILY